MPFLRDLVGLIDQSLRSTYRKTATNAIRAYQTLQSQLAQAISDAYEEYLEEYYPLAVAPAWILNPHWGPKFDVPRNGLSDAEYRLYIQGQALLIESAGERDPILNIILLLLPGASVEFNEFFPKAWTVTITGLPLATILPVVNFLRRNPPVDGARKTPAKGYATAGEQGLILAVDPVVLTYDSVSLGGVPIAAGFGTANPVVVPTPTAGWAHVAEI